VNVQKFSWLPLVCVVLSIAACNRDASVSHKSAHPALEQKATEVNFREGVALYKEGEFTKALNVLRPLAEAGHAESQDYLGGMYADGEGIVKDEKQAFEWYRKAADQGFSGAQHNLGVMYASGRGVQQDSVKAFVWFRKAAEQGNAVSQYNVGIMYAKGEGIVQDYGQAVTWLLKSANEGNADAQDALGDMYANGVGIDRNRTEAIAWFRKAIGQGSEQAKSHLDAMFADGRGFFAVYARGSTQFELSDEPVATCVHLKGEEQFPWKLGVWTSRWSGKVKGCWYKAHVGKQRHDWGPDQNGKHSFTMLREYDVIVFCLPYVRTKDVSQPSCTDVDPESFIAIDSLPRRAF
jgi:TPR repeat protein